MSGFALALVLLAALLHASWNAMIKGGSDRAAMLAAISAAHAVLGFILVMTAPPPSIESWPPILISTLLHYVYYIVLFQAYRHGDLSQVYPISRGMAPVVVAVSAVLLIDETLPPMGWAGLATVSFGVVILAFQGGAGKTRFDTIALALVLGCLIAGYSVADGIGVRASGSALGYMGWLFLLEAPVPLSILLLRHRNGGRFPARTVALGLMGGAFAVTAYGLVLYVKTFAPLGAVSAVRESSVVLAALIGVIVLGERPWRGRLAAAMIVAAGVITLALSG
jgi:drug/metabolite transporter (DMT)-like permease